MDDKYDAIEFEKAMGIDLCVKGQAPCEWAMILISERDESRARLTLAEAALEAADRLLAGVLSLEHTLRKFDSVHPVEMAAESYRGARAAMAEGGERDARCY